MSFHINVMLSATCQGCLYHLELLQVTPKLAAIEARQIGWKLKRDGWRCVDCQEQEGDKVRK